MSKTHTLPKKQTYILIKIILQTTPVCNPYPLLSSSSAAKFVLLILNCFAFLHETSLLLQILFFPPFPIHSYATW